MEKSFPINPVLESMRYMNGVLTISFKKRKGNVVTTQQREYAADTTTAYGLYYKTTAAETLSYYANNVKNKCKVINVK